MVFKRAQQINLHPLNRTTVPRILHSLRGLPSLRYITLIIDTEFRSWDALMASLGTPFMKPVEDAILYLWSIKGVTVELPRMKRLENYALHVAKWTHTVLPQLHQYGKLA